MRKKTILFLILVLFTGITVLVSVNHDAEAMPGFARKYRFTCQTCHAPFPKLKPYGEEFAGNGFRLPEGEPPYSNIDTGDPLLELVRDFPIGVRIDVFGMMDLDDDVKTDLQMPYNLKLISGGPVSEKLSYYFYFFFSERGEVAGIEDAFLYYRDLLGTGINLTAGQFAVSDPIYKNELRLTHESYVIFDIKPPRSLGNLKYDRGVIADYGFDFGLDLVAQVVNGNSIDPADEETKKFDDDTYKSGMFRASQSLFEVFRFGGFAYAGREQNTLYDDDDDAAPDPNRERTSDVRYYGGDASIYAGPFELNLCYLYRTDNNGYFDGTGREVKSQGYMAELQFHPDEDRSRYVITALYNRFDSDFEDEEGINILDYESATLSLTWLLARNARIIGEYTYVIRDLSRGANYEYHNKVKLGVTAAL